MHGPLRCRYSVFGTPQVTIQAEYLEEYPAANIPVQISIIE